MSNSEVNAPGLKKLVRWRSRKFGKTLQEVILFFAIDDFWKFSCKVITLIFIVSINCLDDKTDCIHEYTFLRKKELKNETSAHTYMEKRRESDQIESALYM